MEIVHCDKKMWSSKGTCLIITLELPVTLDYNKEP